MLMHLQVEVDDDPSEAKKDGEEEQTEVMFPLIFSWLFSFELPFHYFYYVCHLLLSFFQKKKTKKVVERYWDWEQTNETQPLWVRILCA